VGLKMIVASVVLCNYKLSRLKENIDTIYRQVALIGLVDNNSDNVTKNSNKDIIGLLFNNELKFGLISIDILTKLSIFFRWF
jgi:hypothetical protein